MLYLSDNDQAVIIEALVPTSECLGGWLAWYWWSLFRVRGGTEIYHRT